MNFSPWKIWAWTLALFCSLSGWARAEYSLDQWSYKVAPVIGAYCQECHSSADPKGGVDLEAIKTPEDAMAHFELMRRVYDAIDFGDMPPAKKPQLTEEDRETVIGWIDYALNEGVNELDPDPGPSVIRRLTREEYSRTVQDLFYIEFDVTEAVGMPSDSIQEGFSFDNLAQVLNVQPLLMEKYFDAAVEVVDRYFYESTEGKQIITQIQNAVDRIRVPQAKRQTAGQFFQGLLSRMFRRPVTQPELNRYLILFDHAMAQGISTKEAFRHMIIAALMSPNFLYRIERDRPGMPAEQAYPISDFELATRLSYFLWSTMPDNELFGLAAEGKLSDPAVYDAQIKRMLNDPKATALAEVFGAQWLELDMLEEARPSQDNFPEYSEELKEAMAIEPIAFLDNLRKTNGSLLDLIDSDYTFANEKLAEFYGIEGVSGDAFQKVSLSPDMNRGGILGMGSVLSMTSHVFRTSPTLRGKYVLAVVLGTPPPVPPANASQISPEVTDNAELRTFRDVLNAHALDPACAGCHKRIDPMGFALDNFDPIGRWREEISGTPVDSSGKLPSGQQLNGFQDLKKVLVERQDQVIQNITQQMLRYALGRHLDAADRRVVNEIVRKVKADGYRFQTLVTEVAKSYPFRHRKNFNTQGGPPVAQADPTDPNRS